MEGNQQKMREALIASFELIQKLERLISAGEEHPAYAKLRADIISGVVTDEIPNVVMKIGRALRMLKKSPIRNCDVGTAEEQGERCLAEFDQWRRKGDGMKLITAIMAWAQMPYAAEEGGAGSEPQKQ